MREWRWRNMIKYALATSNTCRIGYYDYHLRELPYMTSAKWLDFFTPPCPQIHAASHIMTPGKGVGGSGFLEIWVFAIVGLVWTSPSISRFFFKYLVRKVESYMARFRHLNLPPLRACARSVEFVIYVWTLRPKRRIAGLEIYPVGIIYTQMKCPNCQNLLLGLLSGCKWS